MLLIKLQNYLYIKKYITKAYGIFEVVKILD